MGPGPPRGELAVVASVQAGARVKHGVDDVHQHVREDDEGRGEDHDADDDGQVLLADRLDGAPAEAGNTNTVSMRMTLPGGPACASGVQ